MRRPRRALSGNRPAVRRAAAGELAPRDRHRRAHAAGARRGARTVRRHARAVRRAGARPRQGRDAAGRCGRATSATSRPASASSASCANACACRPSTASSGSSPRASTSASIARPELRDATVLEVLESADAFRRPERFEQLLLACEADARGRGPELRDRPYPQAQTMAQLPARRRRGQARCRDPGGERRAGDRAAPARQRGSRRSAPSATGSAASGCLRQSVWRRSRVAKPRSGAS